MTKKKQKPTNQKKKKKKLKLSFKSDPNDKIVLKQWTQKHSPLHKLSFRCTEQ